LYAVNIHPVYSIHVRVTRGIVWRVGDICYNAEWFHVYSLTVYCVLVFLSSYPDDGRISG